MTLRAGLRRLKFLIVAPDFQPWDLGNYLQRLFKTEGLACATFGYGRFPDRAAAGRELLRTIGERRPDVLIGLKLDGIPVASLRALGDAGVFRVLWYVDCFTDDVPGWMVPRLRESDLFLTTAKGMVPRYRSLALHEVDWLYEGVYLPAFPGRTVTRSAGKLYGAQVAFVGSIFQPPVADEALAGHRRRLLAKLGGRHAVKIWGPQASPTGEPLPSLPGCQFMRWPAYNAELVKVCQASAIVLGINTINSVELYFSNRTFLTLASGGFHLTHYVPALETMFENHRHLVWFQSDDECLELTAFYLKRPTARRRIAEEGRRYVRRRYGMHRQFTTMLRLVDASRASR